MNYGFPYLLSAIRWLGPGGFPHKVALVGAVPSNHNTHRLGYQMDIHP